MRTLVILSALVAACGQPQRARDEPVSEPCRSCAAQATHRDAGPPHDAAFTAAADECVGVSVPSDIRIERKLATPCKLAGDYSAETYCRIRKAFAAKGFRAGVHHVVHQDESHEHITPAKYDYVFRLGNHGPKVAEMIVNPRESGEMFWVYRGSATLFCVSVTEQSVQFVQSLSIIAD